MTEFKVNTRASVLDDLRMKINNTRWPDEIVGSGWEFGTDLTYMKSLARYWENEFDWRKVEQEINAYPNFITKIDGYAVHFIHIKSKRKNSHPLIITHGWPGSFLEMTKMIPLLTEGNDLTFDLVIPSMLGFGFSQRVITPGCNAFLMAKLWVQLMQRLGYNKFIAQGGDFGAAVSTAIALRHPEHVLGIHLNYIPGSYIPYLRNGEKLTEEEIQSQESAGRWFQDHAAYAHQHRTKPLTLAYGLNDSPIGLCAWILEKFFSWADTKGDIESVFTKDQLLANITLYWITQTIHSSIRLYNENSKVPFHFKKDEFIKVPVGIARFPFEEPFPPRSFIQRGYNIQHWTDVPLGGHFAAMEQPVLLARDICQFAGMLA